jgi:hypothetical protein
MMVTLSFLFPAERESYFGLSVTWLNRTFDGIGLCQLSTVFEKSLRYRRPSLPRSHAEVYMSTGKIVGMKLERLSACGESFSEINLPCNRCSGMFASIFETSDLTRYLLPNQTLLIPRLASLSPGFPCYNLQSGKEHTFNLVLANINKGRR